MPSYTITATCTCDEIGDSPCPAHYRENQLQDEVIRLKAGKGYKVMSNAVQAYADLVLKLSGLLDREHMATLKHIQHYVDVLFERFPFNVGDKVVLIKTPEISDTVNPGWRGAKHFLVKGAIAHVHSVNFYKGRSRVELSFETESWISAHDGEIHPNPHNSRWVFNESFFALLDDEGALMKPYNPEGAKATRVPN